MSLRVWLAMFVSLIACSQALAETPQIIAGTNKEAEVIFKNRCVVYYTAQGHRKSNLPACSSAQIRQADTALRSYRREQGFDSKAAGRPVSKPVANHNDPHATLTVCCEKNRGNWLTTRELCRGVDGKEVPGGACRSIQKNRPWTPVTDYDNKRVCCERHAHDWFTSRSDCRHSGGYETSDRYCRDDSDNSHWWHANRGIDYGHFYDRPRDVYYAGKADISLTCYGEADKPVLENWDDDLWMTRRESFPAAVVIELNRTGSGYSGRVHPGARLLPPIHSGDRDGWWEIRDLDVSYDSIRGRYKLNAMNKPRLTFDRRSHRLMIDGIEAFYGRCWSH